MTTQTEARDYLVLRLAEAIAYGELPLHCLTGNDCDGYHLTKITEALHILGFYKAEAECKKYLPSGK